MNAHADDGAGLLRADRAYRRRWLMTYVVMVAIGAALVQWAPGWIAGWLGQASLREALAVMQVAIPLVFLSFLAVAGYGLVLGTRIRRAGRYPLQGAKVLVDTPVRRGRDAARIALRLRIGAWLLAATAVTGATLAYTTIGALLERRPPAAEPTLRA